MLLADNVVVRVPIDVVHEQVEGIDPGQRGRQRREVYPAVLSTQDPVGGIVARLPSRSEAGLALHVDDLARRRCQTDKFAEVGAEPFGVGNGRDRKVVFDCIVGPVVAVAHLAAVRGAEAGGVAPAGLHRHRQRELLRISHDLSAPSISPSERGLSGRLLV